MQEGKEQLPLDAKLLSQAIIELNISRRNVAIYPSDHPSIRLSISRAHQHLLKLFELRNEITLAVAKDTLIIDDYFLDKTHPVYSEFALALFKMGLSSITFVTGITEEEITKFHEILTAEPDVILAKGGVEHYMRALGITHLRPSLIDFTAFHYVEGRSVERGGDINLWEDYVYGLLQGKLVTAADAEKIRGIPPAVLAQIMNRSMAENATEESYDKIITSYLTTRSEEKRLQKGSLGNITAFIEGLKPSLKKQFLSGTFRHLSPDPAFARKISEELSSEQLMGLLKEINERDEFIPESLRHLLEKFSTIKQKTLALDARLLSSGESVIDDIQLSPEVVKLFEKDRYQEFVTDTYKDELGKIMAVRFDGDPALTVSDLQEESSDDRIERFLTDVIIEVLETDDSLTEEEKVKMMERLIMNINSFLETGQFDELITIYDTMHQFSTAGRHPEIAASLLDFFASGDFIEHFLTFARVWGRKTRADVIEFSTRIRSLLIQPFLESLIEEEDAALRRFYLSVLSAFGQEVIPAVLNLLHSDERWYVKRNMLFLLRECGDRRVLKDVKPYCYGADVRLAIEAMKAYLHFKDSTVIPAIKKYLGSNNLEERDQVVKMIGTFRVKLLVPDLVKLLLKKDLLGGDFHLRVPVVRALGEIGDERALRYLLEICKSKSLLYKGSLDVLKREIYRSLKHYPPAAAQAFLDLGMQSKDGEIVRICQGLAERAAAHGDR